MVGLPFITANKGPGFADNLYKSAATSYGRAILVIILVLYLASALYCHAIRHNYALQPKLQARYEWTGLFKALVAAVIHIK